MAMVFSRLLPRASRYRLSAVSLLSRASGVPLSTICPSYTSISCRMPPSRFSMTWVCWEEMTCPCPLLTSSISLWFAQMRNRITATAVPSESPRAPMRGRRCRAASTSSMKAICSFSLRCFCFSWLFMTRLRARDGKKEVRTPLWVPFFFPAGGCPGAEPEARRQARAAPAPWGRRPQCALPL